MDIKHIAIAIAEFEFDHQIRMEGGIADDPTVPFRAPGQLLARLMDDVTLSNPQSDSNGYFITLKRYNNKWIADIRWKAGS